MNAENFTRTYITTALNLATNYDDLTTFYEQLFQSLARETGYSETQIRDVHHPFHWALFNQENSPLAIIRDTKKDKWNIEERKNCENPEEVTRQILEKYKITLEAKLGKHSSTFARAS